ncbi:hypothetical protein CALCODRAFT_270194 [Calocera cornea HHB12733]|uniref:E3 ubiquitin protein ligase n=1 Tax=Calocera cornea HHB12733 TaxID=1353952 RepID=A0A165G8X2_9BASI|nr:hypothetical protein CALCODRAFT_270194 [Calocera cornea HHB12733]
MNVYFIVMLIMSSPLLLEAYQSCDHHCHLARKWPKYSASERSRRKHPFRLRSFVVVALSVLVFSCISLRSCSSFSVMEAIKRPLEEDSMTPSPFPKRRVLSSGDGSPVAVPTDNGDIDVELFQKEALWRQMRQYSRDKERAERKVVELQRKQEATEAAMAAMEATWTELLNLLQERAGTASDKYTPENLLRLDRYSTMETLATQFKSQLAERARSTIALVDQLVKPQVKLETESDRSWQQDARRAREEAGVRAAELQLLRNRLQQAEGDLERYKEELSQAEKRVDRSHSKTVQAMESKGVKAKDEPVKESTPAAPTPKEEPTEEPSDVVMEPAVPLTNGHVHVHEVDKEHWELRARERETELQRVSEERLRMQDEIRRLNDQLAVPSRDLILASIEYRALSAEAQEWRQQCEEAQVFTKPLVDRLEKLIAERSEFKQKTEEEYKKRTDELELTIEKRQHDLARLREKWDALFAEKDILKARDAEKSRSSAELKTLVSSCEQRISVLQSEVKRLRTRLAAQAGDADLFAFLLGSGPDAFSQQETTKQLLEARKKIETLEAHLSADQKTIQTALEKARKFDDLFGAESSAPSDVKSAAAALAAKEDELKKARLRSQDDEATADALYSEIDRISAAWDTLEKQNKSKAFELVDLEERVRRLAGEKAQEQSKYFAEKKMQKEAAVQHDAALRSNQSQKLSIEKYEQNERNLNKQVAEHFAAMTKLNAGLHEWQSRVRAQELEVTKIRATVNERDRQLAKLDHLLKNTNAGCEHYREQARKAVEDLKVAKEESERIGLNAKAIPLITSSAGPEVQAMAAENKKLKDILKCSTCHNNFRSQVLLKCMHTFCSECLDARLKSRQRKCPVCSLAFAASDVQTFYFQ